jgi:hypothetical protein
MTVSYLEALITRVDIGQNYPALIKSKLLVDPLTACDGRICSPVICASSYRCWPCS